MTEAIVIPDLDDDDDDLALPSFGRSAFGSASPSSDTEPYTHGKHGSDSSDFSKHTQATLGRAPQLKSNLVNSSSLDDFADPPRIGKHPNGSSTYLTASSQQSGGGSGSGLLGSRKSSFASLKHVFKPAQASAPAVPPLPHYEARSQSTQPYPALKNPWLRFDSPPSPTSSHHNARPRGYTKVSQQSHSSSHYQPHTDRSRANASAHAAQRSFGGRSITSQGSSSFRAETFPVPPIPNRSAPSRGGRAGSVASLPKSSIDGGIGELLDSLGKSPAEEALRAVFQSFRVNADQKIGKLMAKPLNSPHVSLLSTLKGGVDPLFDEVLSALASCARTQARRVVDLLRRWYLQCTYLSSEEVTTHMSQSLSLHERRDEVATVLSSRKSSAARYIYNRALIEIVRTVPGEALGEEVAVGIEREGFNHFRAEVRSDDPSLLVELLGELSKTRFLTVSDRFARELRNLTAAGTKESETHIEHILRGVRELKLRVYPEDELEMAAEFLQSLSAFFANAHGNSLKCAYAETLTYLLHPVVETATAEVNHPVWVKAIAVVLQKAMVMASKPRYWNVAFPLVVVALGVSPREVFKEHWLGCIETVASKTKDRPMRVIGMNAFIRLIWVYLNRCPDSATSTRKRLEGLVRNYLPPHSGLMLPADLPPEPFVDLIYFVMRRQFDYGQELVAECLQEAMSRGSDAATGEILHPERAFVAIRAATFTLRSLEDGQPAAFPSNPNFGWFDPDKFQDTGLRSTRGSSPEAGEFLNRCAPLAVNVLHCADRMVGSVLLSSPAVTLSVHASSAGSGRKHGDVYVSYAPRLEPLFKLQAALIDCLPILLPVSTNATALMNILCRATFSADSTTCSVAANAMRRVAEDPELCQILAENYRQFVFETPHVFKDSFIGTRLLESHLVRVVKLWVSVLEALAAHKKSQNITKQIDSAFVDAIQGAGLFLLCSTNVHLRRLAHPVLAAAREMTGQSAGPSAPFRYSRFIPTKPTVLVVQLFESNVEDADLAVLRRLATLTNADRHRLDTLTGPKLIQQLAESESAKDASLWAAILPVFMGKVNDQLGRSVHELRLLLSQTVLRLQAHVTSVAQGNGARQNSKNNWSSSDSALVAEQWRFYLSVLVATVDPVPSPLNSKSSHDFLAVELFGYLNQILTWGDPKFLQAAVFAYGSVRPSSMHLAYEHLMKVILSLADSWKSTPGRISPMWTAVAHAFGLISPLILDNRSPSHSENLRSLINFVKRTLTSLSDSTIKKNYELHSLRRWFCIVVDNLTTALGQLDASDRFLGEDVRGAIFKLCYDWCDLACRSSDAKARQSQMLQAAFDSYRGDRDRAQYLDDLQANAKLLSIAAAEAMASLCQGKLISVSDATPEHHTSDHIVEPLTVVSWIRGVFQNQTGEHLETARKALHALIKYNWGIQRLADEVLHQSYGEGEVFALDASFFGVVADLISDGTIKLRPDQLACLSLSKLGHPVATVRQRAFQLVVWLIDDSEKRVAAAQLLVAVGSTEPSVYRGAQLEMATTLASLYPDRSIEFLQECTARLGQLVAPRRRETLGILPAFMKVLELEADTSRLGPSEIAVEHQALSNLMYLVVRFSDDHIEDIRDILTSFAGSGKSRNTTALVKFLFEQGAKRGSPDFVLHAQRIMACLAASPAGDVIFDEICDFVEPSAMAFVAKANVPPNVPPSPAASFANLDSLFDGNSRTKTISQGQMALLFAGELLPYRGRSEEFTKRLPTLLHVAFIHCDDANSTLREQAQNVLFQVIRAWISDLSNVQPTDPTEGSVAWVVAEGKLTAVARQQATVFWKADDSGGLDTPCHAPTKMSSLVLAILGILQQLQPNLRQKWGTLALHWGTSCTIRHLACRSFQVFRILSPGINPRMVSDMLARLSSTIASSSTEIQAFNQELMRTFSSIVQSLTAEDMMQYPQIFWCSLACLTTPYEEEFNEVVELLSHVLDKTNLADPAVVSHLASFQPGDLTGPPPLLQPLLLIGLRSAKTDMMTFDVIRRLTSVQGHELIDSDYDRLLHGFVAALPWMLHSTDLGEPNEELACMAFDLVEIAERQGDAGYARLLTSFARARFRTKDDFVRQAALLLREYLGTHALQIVSLLLGFVLNHNEWMRDKALQMLKLVLGFPECWAPLAPYTHELEKPLLRLVATKQAAQALEVLDLLTNMDQPAVSDTSDQLFGAIKASGWSVANPNECSQVTKNNVTAVFNTCAVETRAASAHFSVLQFSDLRPSTVANDNWAASEISLDLPSPPLNVPDNASMGDLVGALHSLNQFFDEGLDPAVTGVNSSPSAPRRTPINTHYSRRGSSTESFGSDGRFRAIMARGLMRSPSANMPIREDMGDEEYSVSSHGMPSFALASTDSLPSTDTSSVANHALANSAGALAPPLNDYRGHGRNGNGGSNSSTQSGGEATYLPLRNGYVQTTLNANAGPRVANLYVSTDKAHHAYPFGHRAGPSLDSESDFGHDTENVFGLDEEPPNSATTTTTTATINAAVANALHAAVGGSHDDTLEAPTRPWGVLDRSRTPSPRDHGHA